jgi:hypothetical protein
MNMFERASRLKLRFPAISGWANTEDLWDLPLSSTHQTSLEFVAIAVNKRLKDLGEESFVSAKPTGTETLQLMLDIVKHIISIRLAEAHAAEIAVQTKARVQAIKGALADLEASELGSSSKETLQAELLQLQQED